MTVLTLEETIQMIRKQLPDYDRKDIMEMIEEKRQELGPEVVNEESAAMIVARELGIDLHQIEPRARQKINDISESNKNVTLSAKVIHIGTVRTFSRKDGGEGKVASIRIADDSGQIRVALWDEMTRAVSEDLVSVGSVVQIRSAYVKKGLRDELELNLGRMGGIKVLEDYEIEDMDFDVGSPESTKINDLVEKMYDVTLTVKVQRVFNMSTFTRKSDNTEGKVLSMIVADETGTTRLVFWDEFAEKMQDAEESEVIRVSGAYTKTGRNEGEIEVHGGRSVKVDRDLKQDIKAVESSGRAPAEELGRKSIGELELGMRDVDIEVKVLRLFPPTQFERDGTPGQVQNVIVTDESGQTIRVAFWNEDVEKMKDLKEGDILRLSHGYVKKGFKDDIEYGVGRNAEIKINPKDSMKKLKQLDLSDMSFSPPTRAGAGRIRIGEIDEAGEGNTVEVCGVIVGIGQICPVYPACPECRKKVNITDDGKYSCVEHGDLPAPDYRMLYKITVDDGSGSIRVTLFGEAGEELLQMSADEAQKLIEKTKNDKAPIEQNSDKMLGSYVVIKGRINKYQDSLDIGASSLSFADPVEEIKRMKESIDELA